MAFLLLLLLTLSSSSAYNGPFCFSSGVTWSSPVSEGIQSVTTPEECQLMCADSSDCDAVTWYDNQASPHSNYCEMFLNPDPSQEVSCTNCKSGPESCTCSGHYSCSLDSSQLVDLIFDTTSEISCAELCYQIPVCEYYSWFTPDDHLLKDTCALLRGCSDRLGSNSCMSGPADCIDTDIIASEFPLCYNVGLTWSEDERGVANISSPYKCQELCNKDEECSYFTWYSSMADLHQDFCEFYSTASEPTSSCMDCMSGPASCTCSVTNYQTCDTSQEQVIDIIQQVESEVKCQDLCARNEGCSWYTWYSEQGDRLKLTCILLETCTQRTDCQGCSSGPDFCDNASLMSLPPQCTDYEQLSSYTRNVIVPGGSLCGGQCCDTLGSSHHPSDWVGAAWYRFTGSSGSKILEHAPGDFFCGTVATGYMAGGHPTVEDGEVTKTVYFDYDGDHQNFLTNISVINCHQYFVYYLPDTPGCTLGYCGV